MPLYASPEIGPATGPPIRSLDDLTAKDLGNAGAKAVNLGRMRRAGLPVPPGFCVTGAAYRLWLAACPQADPVLRSLDQLDPNAADEVHRAAASLRALLANHPLPGPVERAISAALERHGADLKWAVRSSATAEDSPDASCAGQHDSLLDVQGAPTVCEAVRHCWISAFTDRAVSYQLEHHIPPRSTSMAVVVQEMVAAELAGVLFTADPVSGDRTRLMIEAVRGLGDALVSGRASPDRLVLERDTLRVLESSASASAVATGPEAFAPGRGEPAPAHPNGACLDAALARSLAQLGCAAERLFDGPQDVEWAMSQGRIFLVQSRPITALPRPGTPSDADVWTNANAMELLPDVVTPMSWSVMDGLMDEFVHPLLRWLGVDATRHPVLGLVAGRAYLNVRTIMDLVRNVAGPISVDFTEAFGGQRAALEPFLRGPASPRRGWFNPQGLKTMIKLAGWLLPALPRVQRLLDRWRALSFGDLSRVDPTSLSDEQLGQYPQSLMRPACAGEGMPTWAAATWMCVAAVGATTAVARLTRRWLDDADGRIANRLIAGASGMNSAENGLELLRLAAWVRQRPALQLALLAAGPFAALPRRLTALPEGPEFLDRWRTFMERHGHQARGGMDLAQPRWAERPDFVLDMLRVYLQFSEADDPLAAQARRRGEREQLLLECRRRLRNPAKRWLLGFLVSTGQRGLVQRENLKNEGVRLIALIRRAILEAGRRLVERGALREVGDVFFLRVEELTPVLLGRPPFDIAATVTRRKAQHAKHQALSPPPVVIGRYDPRTAAPDPIGPGARTLAGLAVSPGAATGKARVILQADTAERVLPGEILVAPYTDPGWTPYFLAAAGLVVDVGGLLSHGSVVAREYGLPAVVNVGAATRLIKTGQTICVDGDRGVVTLLD